MYDIETDGLDSTVIWCLVLKNIDTKEVLIFANGLGYEPVRVGVGLLRAADYTIGHNVIWFDLPVLNKLEKAGLEPERQIDTLVVSRLLNSWDYAQHGLEAWGERLGYPKTYFKDWSHLSQEMIDYCVNDVEVNFKLWEQFRDYVFSPLWKDALRVEHDTAIFYREMHENGFPFDREKAEKLRFEIDIEREKLNVDIQREFPPKAKFLGEIYPKVTKNGVLSLVNFKWLDGVPEKCGYQPNAPFSRIIWEEFNPASPTQVIDRMHEFGWEPTEKTKGHIAAERDGDLDKLEHFRKYGWKISEENLKTLSPEAPKAAHSLVRWLLLNSRVTTLTTWLEAYDERTRRIHGTVKHIGTWTHRASHTDPNTGNITRVNYDKDGNTLWGEAGDYGADFRSLWTSIPGWKLVGCDAEGIQLRVLAHYMEDDEFTKALVSGSSKDKTDVHSLNQQKLGHVCKTRDVAKTFIYSWVLGASATKSAIVLSCKVGEAVQARKQFLEGYPGLKRIKQELIPADAERGYFEGFDGRKVFCDSEHLMLAGYLQNGENLIMKYANRLWQTELKKLHIPFQQVNMVHDEFQTLVLDEEGFPEEAGKVMAQSIVQAGIDLGVKCPQAGKAKIGMNWYDTH